MFKRDFPIGSLLGHACGSVGVMVGLDLIFTRLDPTYSGLFPYPPAAAAVVSLLMIAQGSRVVRENQRRRNRGPWGD